MSKKIVDKFKESRRKETPEISQREHELNCDAVFEMLMNVAERLPADSLSGDDETIDDLMMQLKTGVKSPPVVIQSADGRRIKHYPDGSQEILGESAPAPAVGRAEIAEGDASKTDALAMPEMPAAVADIAEIVRLKNFRR